MGPVPDQSTDDTSSDDEKPSADGFGETNSRTNGKEFYGPAATLAFLLELRSRARVFQRQSMGKESRRLLRRRESSNLPKSSIVNLMDGEDNSVGVPGKKGQLFDHTDERINKLLTQTPRQWY